MATSLTLIERVGAGSHDAWCRFDSLYRPFIQNWFVRNGVDHHDSEELTQEVMSVVAKEVDRFDHSGKSGAFRNWLRQITHHRALGYWRKNKLRQQPIGGEDGLVQLASIEDPSEEAHRRWDREHDTFILKALVHQIADEFSSTTIDAFWKVGFEGQSASETAEQLGLSAGAVYIAKSRVLRRLREEAKGLVSEERLQ
ncbi:MAG: sigma-70 family RNA polymerase sigma factor [Pirellulaceae bacterium]